MGDFLEFEGCLIIPLFAAHSLIEFFFVGIDEVLDDCADFYAQVGDGNGCFIIDRQGSFVGNRPEFFI